MTNDQAPMTKGRMRPYWSLGFGHWALTLAAALMPAVCFGAWVRICLPDGTCRIVEVPDACGPAGQPQRTRPAPLEPASEVPALPPVPVPSKPLVPLVPKAAEPHQTEVIRVESIDPVKVEPVGPQVAKIADSLAAIAGQFADAVKGRPSWPPAFGTPSAGGRPESPTGTGCERPEATPAPLPPDPGRSRGLSGFAINAIDWLFFAAAGIGGTGVAGWAAWRVAKYAIGKIRLPSPGVSQHSGSQSGSLRWYTEQLDALRGQVQDLMRQLAERPPRTEYQPVVVQQESPPPPPIVERDRQFVQVEVPTKRLASLEWAMDAFVKKHPGAQSTVEAIDAWARQYESGMREKRDA